MMELASDGCFFENMTDLITSYKKHGYVTLDAVWREDTELPCSPHFIHPELIFVGYGDLEHTRT
jgi:hypothetical protein